MIGELDLFLGAGYVIAVRHGRIGERRQLTIVATVLLPLTFLTGFFGQNFGWLSGHTESLAASSSSAWAASGSRAPFW